MPNKTTNYNHLAQQIKQWGIELGFQAIGIADVDLSQYEKHFRQWLKKQSHAEMTFMTQHKEKRFHPEKLLPNTCRIISVSMNYFTDHQSKHVAQYALYRDYHKLLRKKLQTLADKIAETIGLFHYRAFVDSAPVLEKPLAEKAGLGWIGKNCCLINKKFGSFFFLGELFVDIPLPIDQPTENQCGNCQACLAQCPTKAIDAPYSLNTNRCISYLTIEHKGAIPENLRSLIGQKIFGCDCCQNICPWNHHLQTQETNELKHNLILDDLIELFHWDEKTFLTKTQGTVFRRIGYENWLRNIAIALGNLPTTTAIIKALKERMNHPSDLVREHVKWALNQHIKKN